MKLIKLTIFVTVLYVRMEIELNAHVSANIHDLEQAYGLCSTKITIKIKFSINLIT